MTLSLLPIGYRRSTFILIFIGLVSLANPWGRDFFIEGGHRWLYIFFLSFLITFALTPLVRHLGIKFGIMDIPDARRVHQSPTPRVGGIAVFLGFLIAVLANGIVPYQMGIILLAGVLLLLMGIVDDAYGLPAWVKLVAQLAASGMVISGGIVLTLFSQGIFGDMGNIFLTVFWLLGITNAFNFMDGMDGLAPGLAGLLAFFLGLVSFETNQVELGWLSVAIAGAVIGFLPYNFRGDGPALIFLGDGGAIFLGFTLACLAIMGEWADHNSIVSLTTPVLIFWVLIYDMTHLTIERVWTGKVHSIKEWLDYVGKDHLHHRLSRALGGDRASVLMIFVLTLCSGIGAMVLRTAETSDAIFLIIQASLLVLMLTIFEIRSRPEFGGNSNE